MPRSPRDGDRPLRTERVGGRRSSEVVAAKWDRDAGDPEWRFDQLVAAGVIRVQFVAGLKIDAEPSNVLARLKPLADGVGDVVHLVLIGELPNPAARFGPGAEPEHGRCPAKVVAPLEADFRLEP